SRRRHTRSKRDWSSDVCSSDLKVLRAGMVAGCEGIVFPSHAIGKSEFGSHFPAVPRVPSPGGEAQRVWVDVLDDFAVSLRESEHELGKTTVRVVRASGIPWRATQRSHASVEPKGASRRSEGSPLRLEVVDPTVLVLEAEANIVP